jgi:hypothetical protein
MNAQTQSVPSEIQSYEEYLRVFFPHPEQSTTSTATPKEIGAQMAAGTLEHIRKLLARDAVDQQHASS